MLYKKVINFLCGWLPVIKKPKWLIKNVNKYICNYEKKYKILPYNVIKHFYGKTFVYKVIFESQGQGFVKPIYYKKYRIIKK